MKDQVFHGFEENRKLYCGIPNQFFGELLPAIDDLDELKLTLYMLWSAYSQGDYGTPFRLKDFLTDQTFLAGLQGKGKPPQQVIENCLQQVVLRGSIIRVEKAGDDEPTYFINSPRGRQAAALAQNGQSLENGRPKPTLDVIQPNIFRLYEENIGPLTPIIAETLREAQETYPQEWIVEALQLAVKSNVRRWKYVESILKRWQEEGRDGANRRDNQEDHRRYLKGEYGQIGHH